jgi:tetratricopeptide (TPR) repeat protein
MISMISISVIVTLAILSSFQFPVTEALNATPMRDKAMELSESGDFTGAIEYFDRCLAINPYYLSCLVNKANTLYYSGDAVGAIELLDRVLELYPEEEDDVLKNKEIFCKGDIVYGDENSGSIKTVPSTSCFDLE